MEEVALSGKSSDAVSGCNYGASSSDEIDATVSSADMILQHQHHPRGHPHQFQTGHGQGRLLPPQYDSLTSPNNNNNSYSADSVSNDSKYYQLTAHLLGQGYPYHHYHHHNHLRYQSDHQQQQQLAAQYQLDYCNAVTGGSYGMTSSSSVSAVSGSGLVSRAGYCRGAGAAAYSAGETRSQAGYWASSCGVGTDQQQQPSDPDDQADVKPTLLDASSYLVPSAQYPARHQGYLHPWYQPTAGYGWGVPGSGSDTGGYYTASSGYSDVISQSTSPPMHHILRGVYNTLQVSECYTCIIGCIQ